MAELLLAALLDVTSGKKDKEKAELKRYRLKENSPNKLHKFVHSMILNKKHIEDEEDVSRFRVLLANTTLRAAVDQKDKKENTVLDHALLAGYYRIARELLEAGANILSNDNGCALKNMFKSIKADSAARTVLFVEWLLKHFDETGKREQALSILNSNRSVLLTVCNKKCEQLRTVELLIKYGVDVNKIDDEGCQPIHVASKHGHDDIVRLLIKHHANPNASDSDQCRPIHLATANGQSACVVTLLKAGAHIDVPCGEMSSGEPKYNNKLPLELAEQGGHHHTAAIIREWVLWRGVGSVLDAKNENLVEFISSSSSPSSSSSSSSLSS